MTNSPALFSLIEATIRLRDGLAALNERQDLDGLCDSDLERIAVDIGVSVSELRAVAVNGDWQRLLDTRLSRLGLDRAALEQNLPRVLRDLERTCSGCTSGSRCTKDFARSRTAAISGYCPNTHTLEALLNAPEAHAPQVGGC